MTFEYSVYRGGFSGHPLYGLSVRVKILCTDVRAIIPTSSGDLYGEPHLLNSNQPKHTDRGRTQDV